MAKKTARKNCFLISPIGKPGSEINVHANRAMEIIKEALNPLGFDVTRGDMIEKFGSITDQIIERLLDDPIAVCDLSFHNPNVFYELAVRDTMQRPTILIIRETDEIPFDQKDMRIIRFGDLSLYKAAKSLMADISKFAKAINLNDPITNPVSRVLRHRDFSTS